MEDTANILKKEEIILNISSTYKPEKLAKDKLHRKDHVETIRTRMKRDYHSTRSKVLR